MKGKYFWFAIAILPSVFFLLTSDVASARTWWGWWHHSQPPVVALTSTPPVVKPTSTSPVVPTSTPPPVIVPPPINVSGTIIQWGAYTGNTQATTNAFASKLGVIPEWQMVFTDTTFPSGLSGNLEIFIEPQYSDSQVLAGAIDSQLKSFAQAALKYSGKIMMPLNEEVNCNSGNPWEVGVSGNTIASSIATYQHEYAILKATDPNIQVGFSVNNTSCDGGSALQNYYPGNAYVDFIGIDGYSFASTPQTWDQVFDSAITAMSAYDKPIWVAAEGSTSNQSQFLSDTVAGIKKYNLAGFLYFNQISGGWVLTSQAMSTLVSLVK